MIKVDKQLFDHLFEKALASDRKRMNYDLRTSDSDNSQRMLNALLPETQVPVHCHPNSNENIILLSGKLYVVLYEEVAINYHFHPHDEQEESIQRKLVEKDRFLLDASAGNYGCVVPPGVWHTVEVLEPSVIYEAKDGRYGADGSKMW